MFGCNLRSVALSEVTKHHHTNLGIPKTEGNAKNDRTPRRNAFHGKSLNLGLIREWGANRILTNEVSRYTRICIKTLEMKVRSAPFRYLLRYGHLKIQFQWHNWNSP